MAVCIVALRQKTRQHIKRVGSASCTVPVCHGARCTSYINKLHSMAHRTYAWNSLPCPASILQIQVVMPAAAACAMHLQLQLSWRLAVSSMPAPVQIRSPHNDMIPLRRARALAVRRRLQLADVCCPQSSGGAAASASAAAPAAGPATAAIAAQLRAQCQPQRDDHTALLHHAPHTAAHVSLPCCCASVPLDDVCRAHLTHHSWRAEVHRSAVGILCFSDTMSWANMASLSVVCILLLLSACHTDLPLPVATWSPVGSGRMSCCITSTALYPRSGEAGGPSAG